MGFAEKAVPVIMQCAVILAGVGLPAFAAFIYQKFKGNARYAQAVKLAEAAIQAIRAYFLEHPDAMKSAQAIFELFRERIEAVMPLTDAELTYLFKQFEAALAALLGVDVAIFAVIQAAPAGGGKAARGEGNQKRLFA